MVSNLNLLNGFLLVGLQLLGEEVLQVILISKRKTVELVREQSRFLADLPAYQEQPEIQF